jgi:hypothetical protein
MRDEEYPRYWFPAKRHGWGWGLPVTWEGWLVLGVWFAVIMSVTPDLVRRDAWLLYALFVALMVVALVAICHLKGEPPAWRRKDR